ncbi:MAG TPA: hypothetical protein VK215_16175 [Acidimicrobiales bacterium]|nr:hypothetical protein [Acidimicrobiales bacterium]HLN43996.1 hypothetical protein [Acidimicrobiales bacterium]
MQQYFTASEGGGTTTLVACPGRAGPTLFPAPVAVHDHGADAEETMPRQSGRLALIMVVNGAIAGLVATMVFGAVEIAIHLLP